MFFHILKRDLKRKKTMNFILLLFIILATMFLAASINNLVVINGAVDYFMEISKVPDFFAIVVSEEKNNEISSFLEKNENLAEYEILDTFLVTDDCISIVQSAKNPDNSQYKPTSKLCLGVVPSGFMKVFRENGEQLELKDGEIAFSKVEADENHLEVGDKVKITVGKAEQEFTVAVIMKDAVFGSPMMGFKRLIITENDFSRFAAQSGLSYTKICSLDYGNKEAFKSEWNRQDFNVLGNEEKATVKMCYVFDMLMAGILVVVSICLILIAFLVLRFTIVFTLQEDYKEIGIMKAIGVRDPGIKGIYLVKYLALSLVGAVIGFFLSFPFGDMLLKQVIVNMIAESTDHNKIVNLISALVVIAVILLFCYHSTGRLKKFSAMDAIRNGSNGERYRARNHLKLWKRKRMKPCFFLAANDILSGFKRFWVLAVTFCIGTMLILLPLSALHTLQSDSLVELFSLSVSDAYLDTGEMDLSHMEEDPIQKAMDHIEEKLKENGIKGETGADIGYIVPCYSHNPEETNRYFTLQATGSWERSYSVLEGREPVLENEVMITDITAKEMKVSIGDSIYYQYPDKTEEFVITGLYQSMMNLGNGFRVGEAAHFDPQYTAGIFCIQVEIPDMESGEACEKLREILPEYKVRTAGEFTDSLMGNIKAQMDVMSCFILGIVLVINSLITILMMKTIMTKERGDIALLKSMGFPDRVVRYWQTARILLLLITGIFAGTILSNLSAPFVVGPVFGMMGATNIKLVINPLEAYVIYPLVLLFVTGICAFICAGGVRKVEMKEVNNME